MPEVSSSNLFRRLPRLHDGLSRAFVGCLLAGVAWSPAARALDPERPTNQYVHDFWGAREGLPQSTVQEITQDGNGFLWLGTEEGLARFDGVAFAVFDRRNAPEMTNHEIRALAPRGAGGVWIGTWSGLHLLTGGRVRHVARTDGSSFGSVESLAEGTDGTLWIGTQGDGLFSLRNGRETRLSSAEGLPGDTVWALLADGDGGLWAGTSRGLARLDGGTLQPPPAMADWPRDFVSALRPAAGGGIWAASASGVRRCRSAGCELVIAAAGLPDARLQALWEDRDGNLWLGSRRGLHRHGAGGLTTFAAADGLSQDTVRAIYEDREGSLWVGTSIGGLDRFRDGRFTTYDERHGLRGEVVYSASEDPQGNVWAGTSEGLNRLSPTGIETWGPEQGLPPGVVAPVYADRSGAVWLGVSGGVARLAGSKITLFTPAEGLGSDRVLSIAEDARGTLWVGTTGGISRFDGSRIENLAEPEGLPCRPALALAPGRDGGLWAGMSGCGLVHRQADDKGGRVTTWGREQGLASDVVNAVLEDSDGVVWVGTDEGLSRLAQGRLHSFTFRDGLFDDRIFQVLDDGRGHLWMSSNRGVFRVAKQELAEVTAGVRQAVTSLAFGEGDGMGSAECNGKNQPAGFRGRDGRLWFPTARGLTVTDPARLRFNPVPPPVLIEALLADGEPAPASRRLPPGRRRIEVRYTAPTFLSPERVRFRIRLLGFDPDWLPAGDRRAAFYTNLPPGDYRFEVAAANSDGAWTPEPAALAFSLAPRFYQSAWFYAACALVAGLAAWAGYRLHIRQIRARFDAVIGERNRIAREIHDTLAQGLAAVSLQLEGASGELETAPPEARTFLDRARTLVREALAAARRSVLNLRAAELEEQSLPEALAALAAGLESPGAPPIAVRLVGQPRPLPEAIEDHLFRIAQEAVANALKHAEARSIAVELAFGEKLVRLRVEDDGKGFAAGAEEVGGEPHFGLAVMRERAAALSGHLAIRPRPAGGTEVTVAVPLGA